MATPRNPPSKRPEQRTHFAAVFQLDEPQQMEVFRWLQSDDTYRVIWILHDRDYDDEGNRKKPHYHMIVKSPRKMQASTMFKRFGGYVYFEALGDPSEYARYLTHSTFDSRSKTRYDAGKICGDIQLYNELRHTQESTPIESVERWLGYKRAVVNSGAIDDIYYTHLDRCKDAVEQVIDRAALRLALDAGDLQLVKSIMSHSYFYKTFT